MLLCKLRETGQYPNLYWGKAKRDEENRFIRLHYGSMPTDIIAEHLGMKEKTVNSRARSLGFATHTQVLTKEKVSELAEQGLTREEIAKKLGADYNNVRGMIQRHKIPCVRQKRQAFRVKY